MSSGEQPAAGGRRWFWGMVFALIALYVAARMGVFALWATVATADGAVRLPNTFASVDHPFHVARAEILWRELASGNVLRWVGQHQGGYPVEFYPLGEAWLEVLIRALSLGTLPVEGAHTVAVIALFLLPGFAFAVLAREDGWTPAVAVLALVLHVALPGGWYSGGYTELVQWGLVTNVASAVASLLMLPFLVRFLRTGEGWAGALAGALAAYAVYCNPRSMIGLAALGVGAWLAATTARGSSWRTATGRIALVAAVALLLAAPELIALARFGGLYAFVRYSGYEGIGDYARTSVAAVTLPVIVLAVSGIAIGLASAFRLATRSVSAALMLYVALTAVLTAAPGAAALVSQLEPTRLMPLQRLLTLYLAAVAVWRGVCWALQKLTDLRVSSVLAAGGGEGDAGVAPTAAGWRSATAVAVGISLLITVIQTRPISGPPLDPASSVIPEVSLYPVAMSAQPEQVDFVASVRAADMSAPPGTAILVLGSALSWHQQLWAPLWTRRPLYFDNWLWSWRLDHAGTPGYRFAAGNHYPDPERTLEREYLARHGIGAAVVTGEAQGDAAVSPLLAIMRPGGYDAYVVRDPGASVTFGNHNAMVATMANQTIAATAGRAGSPVTARVNWFPRWVANVDGEPASVGRTAAGYMDIDPGEPAQRAEFAYTVEPLDWLARMLALGGLALFVALLADSLRGRVGQRRWYAPRRAAGEDAPRG